MTWQAWLVLMVAAALWLYLRHRHRYPDKGCPRCGETGRLRSTRPITGALVSGLCPRCGGSPWSPRRI